MVVLLVAVYFLTRRSVQGFDTARARAVPFFGSAALLVLGAVLFLSAKTLTQNSVVLSRNFYGVLT